MNAAVTTAVAQHGVKSMSSSNRFFSFKSSQDFCHVNLRQNNIQTGTKSTGSSHAHIATLLSMCTNAEMNTTPSLLVPCVLKSQRTNRRIDANACSIPPPISWLTPHPCWVPQHAGPTIQIGAVIEQQGSLQARTVGCLHTSPSFQVECLWWKALSRSLSLYADMQRQLPLSKVLMLQAQCCCGRHPAAAETWHGSCELKSKSVTGNTGSFDEHNGLAAGDTTDSSMKCIVQELQCYASNCSPEPTDHYSSSLCQRQGHCVALSFLWIACLTWLFHKHLCLHSWLLVRVMHGQDVYESLWPATCVPTCLLLQHYYQWQN